MNDTTIASITTAAQMEAEQAVPAVPEGFHVRDGQTANWVVRRIIEARCYGQRVRAWAARELRRAENEEKFFLHRFGHQLEDWVRRELEAEDVGRKSVNLPAGTTGFRTTPSHLEIRDEQQLIQWCKANLPTAIAVTESVLKTALMDHISDTGELPIGAELIHGREKFFVK